MKSITKLSVKGLMAVAMLMISVGVFSQTMKEAVDAFNKGASLAKTDPDGAIVAYESCIKLASQLGEEGTETKADAEKQLPLMYFKSAVNLYKKKDFDGAIAGFKKSKEVADKYENKELSSKSERIIPQVYYAKGSTFYKKKNFESAMTALDKAIELNPKYAKPYLVKASIYKNQDDEEKFLEACDKGLEVGNTIHDKKTITSIKKLAKNSMFNSAVKAIEAEKWSEAEKYLNNSIKYGNESADVFYQLGKVYNAEKKWDDAITTLEKSLALDTKDEAGKAKYYYELGVANSGKGNNEVACSSFKKAMHGQYLQNAKYQVEQVLKCK
jgi:tetratricopeptide (TPR) repeat protein